MFTTLAERLQRALDAAKMKPSALARACGVKQPSVSDWLTGRTMTMKADKLRLAAAALDVDRDWLETGKGLMHQPTGTCHSDQYQAQSSATKPDIGETVARLGELLGGVPRNQRSALAPMLAALVLAPDSRELLAQLTDSIRAAVQTAEKPLGAPIAPEHQAALQRLAEQAEDLHAKTTKQQRHRATGS